MARLDIRISDADKNELLQKAKSLDISVSELVRQGAKRANSFSLENRKLAIEKNRELNRIGNNLNQIARWVNSNKSKAESVSVIAHLISIQEWIEEL
jgi:post-segregation antitoxin (ccd killing protein)